MDSQSNNRALERDRREFLISAGKFAAVVPPAMTVLLSTSINSPAIAQSAATALKMNNGVGNGGASTAPAKSNRGKRGR